MTASLSIGRVTLVVHDLARVTEFYQRIVGLHVLSTDGTVTAMGAGDTVLLDLVRDPAARRRSPRDAGLFHTAFLLPTRADLGRWVRFASEARAPVVGASDHLVSEAIYLTDPEGNGVEIYSDRPASSWRWSGGTVEMATEALDIPDLAASAGGTAWQGFPEGATVGHVHLQVGAIPPAEAFYADILGLDITCHYPGGSFYAVDGYHHHIATNVWNSRGAPVREMPSTGLADVEIRVSPDRLAAIEARTGTAANADGRLSLADPWATPITLVRG